MACGSGCCGPPTTAVTAVTAATASGPQPTIATAATDPDATDDGCSCCEDEIADASPDNRPKDMFCAGEDTCCAGESKVDACCSALEETDNSKNKGKEGEMSCCGLPDKTAHFADKACIDVCCGSEDPVAEIAAPSCCEGKASPCCDTACLDELALDACEGSSSVQCCDGGETGKPCEDHTRSTYQMYAERLTTLGCICRLLVSLGRESCCDRKERRRRRLPRRGKRRSERSTKEGCCSEEKPAGRDDCCSRKEEQDCTEADACKKACCQPATPNVAVNPLDLEMGGSATDTEHIVLSISGMTCTGCETKLSRSLGGLPAVTNVKTSLVLSRAEFDLVPGPFSVEDVMRHLARTTEFSCERVATTGTRLDLAVPGDAGRAEAIVRQLCEPASWPSGVTDVVAVDKQTVRLTWDPIVVGARELLQDPWTDFGDVGRLALVPQPRTDPTLLAGRSHVHQLAWTTALSAVLTIPVLVLAWAPLPQHDMAYGGASLALATAVQVVVAGPFYPRAVKSLLFAHVVEMDLLVVLSTSAAYVFSVVSFGFLAAGRPLATGDFFETSTLLVTLIVAGRFVAALARQTAVESMSVRSLQAASALLVVGDGPGRTVSIDARLLQYGDVFQVMPDASVPTDGTVLAGRSEVDESMITGESLPVAKRPGSAVVAGTLNGSGLLRVRLTRLPGDNTVSTLASLADEARLSKPRIQALADRVASCFVPVVVALAVLTFVVWIAVGIAVRRQSAAEATIRAVTFAITVLIVSCPCAIGLAVPMVVVVAGGLAARHGVLFASSAALELAHRTTDVVFDKTGTLTEGRLAVVHEACENRPDARSLLLGLVSHVRHPVSRAVAAHLSAQGIVAAAVTDVQVLAGKGVQGRSASGQALQAGNTRWLALPDDDTRVRQAVAAAGPCTVFCLAVDGDLAAVLCLADTVRADAASTVAVLHRDDIHVHILSGDDAGAVDVVAAQLGVPAARVRSRCSPADKMEYVRDLVASGVVLFCGDGTNDAAALAQATVGVHMAALDDDESSPIAAAQAAADVVLMRPRVAGVLTVMAVSRAAVRRIAWNFAWSAVYNVLAVLLAAGAFVHARIPPAYAGLGELVSVLPVIAAAVMLRWARV